MRRAARIDANHAAIVKALQEIPGVGVLSLAAVGNGCPDLLVARFGQNVLVEIKDGGKSPSRRSLTVAQRTFHEIWPGRVIVAESLDDVLRVIGL